MAARVSLVTEAAFFGVTRRKYGPAVTNIGGVFCFPTSYDRPLVSSRQTEASPTETHSPVSADSYAASSTPST